MLHSFTTLADRHAYAITKCLPNELINFNAVYATLLFQSKVQVRVPVLKIQNVCVNQLAMQ